VYPQPRTSYVHPTLVYDINGCFSPSITNSAARFNRRVLGPQRAPSAAPSSVYPGECSTAIALIAVPPNAVTPAGSSRPPGTPPRTATRPGVSLLHGHDDLDAALDRPRRAWPPRLPPRPWPRRSLAGPDGWGAPGDGVDEEGRRLSRRPGCASVAPGAASVSQARHTHDADDSLCRIHFVLRGGTMLAAKQARERCLRTPSYRGGCKGGCPNRRGELDQFGQILEGPLLGIARAPCSRMRSPVAWSRAKTFWVRPDMNPREPAGRGRRCLWCGGGSRSGGPRRSRHSSPAPTSKTSARRSRRCARRCSSRSTV